MHCCRRRWGWLLSSSSLDDAGDGGRGVVAIIMVSVGGHVDDVNGGVIVVVVGGHVNNVGGGG